MHPVFPLSRWLLTLWLTLAVAAPAIADERFEWLDIRRQGAEGIAQLGRERTAVKPWQRTYKAEVPAGHPLAGVKLTVARAFTGQSQLHVRVSAGPAQLVGTGVVVDGAKAWVRVVGEKVKPLPQETLFRPQPTLDVPWIVFCALEWPSRYAPAVEGEFDQVAVLRLTPAYQLGVTARPAKATISKIRGHLVAMAINDGKGNKLGEVDWAVFDGEGRPGELLLRGPGDKAVPMRFVAEGAAGTPARDAFKPSSLK